MTLLRNNAAGLNVGDTPTPANTGGTSGDAFTSVTQGTSAAITVDNGQTIRGTRAYKLAITATTANTAYLQWDLAAGVASATARIDAMITAQSTSTPSYITFLNSAGALVARIRLTSGGLLNVVNAAGSGVATGTAVVVGTGPFRIEATVTPGTTTTNGHLTVNLYQPADSDVPKDTLTVTTGNFGTTDVRSCQFGNTATISQASYSYWFTDVAFNDTGAAIGPDVTGTPKVIDLTETDSSSTTATSLVMNAPPGTGGLLVCFIFALTQIVFTPADTGWQELDPGNPGNGWWKWDDGATSWTFNYPGGNRPGGVVLRIEGADPSSPIAAVGHVTANATAPSVSPSDPNCLVIAAWSKTRGDSQVTIDPALTPLWRRPFSTTQQLCQHAGGYVLPGGSPTSAYTATADAGLGAFVDAFQVAIRPAGGGAALSATAGLVAGGQATVPAAVPMAATAGMTVGGQATVPAAATLAADAGMTVTGGIFSGTATATFELWEYGTFVTALGAFNVDSAGTVVDLAFDPALLSDPSGRGVEIRMVSDGQVDVGAIEWVVSYVTPVEGAVSMTATAGLTVTGDVAAGAAIALTATGGLTVDSRVTELAAVLLAATGGLSIASVVVTTGIVTLDATAALTVVDIVTAVAGVTMTAEAELAVMAEVLANVVQPMVATATLTVAGARVVVGVITLTADTGLTVAAVVILAWPWVIHLGEARDGWRVGAPRDGWSVGNATFAWSVGILRTAWRTGDLRAADEAAAVREQ